MTLVLRDFVNVHRVSAIEGDTLDITNAFIDESVRQTIRLKKRTSHKTIVSKRTVACFLSHLKALRLFLESKENLALILEDDIPANTFSEYACKTIQEQFLECKHCVFDKNNVVWNLYSHHTVTAPLETNNTRNHKCTECKLEWSKIVSGQGAVGYIVDHDAAKRILNTTKNITMHYDHWLAQLSEWGVVNLVKCHEQVLSRGVFTSSLDHIPLIDDSQKYWITLAVLLFVVFVIIFALVWYFCFIRNSNPNHSKY